MTTFLIHGHDIGQYAGYKTRVIADSFFEISTESDIPRLSEIFQMAQSQHIPLLFISGGTNLLFASSRFAGIAVKNSLSGWSFDSDSKLLTTASAEKIWHIAETLETHYHEPLWHRFIGLPGTIAGAVVGNAGCFGLETASNFLDATAYNMRT